MKVEPIFPELEYESLESINGLEFEDLCLKLFRHMYANYHVQKTNINDFGADILVHFDYGRKMVIQCKTAQNGKQVGIKAVQEAISSKESYDAEFVSVVSNSTFTSAAEELAEVNNVTLIDIHSLIRSFSRTTFELQDLSFIYSSALQAFNTNESTYLDKFRENPQLLFQLSKLETLHMLKFCLGDSLKSNMVDIEDELYQGVHYIIYLAILNGRMNIDDN